MRNAVTAGFLLLPLSGAFGQTRSSTSTELATDTARAIEVTRFVQKNYFNDKTSLYHEKIGDMKPAAMWSDGIVFSMLAGSYRYDPQAIGPLMRRFFVALDGYWDRKQPKGGYEPYPGNGDGNDKYFDDNEWMAITFTEAAELTGDRRYLARADETMRWVHTGWDDELGGGIWWHEKHNGGTKNTCANGPAAVACLRIHLLLPHGKAADDYLTWAGQIIHWTKENLQDKDGLFQDNKKAGTGEIGYGILTYNTALMVRAQLGMYYAKNDPAALADVRKMESAADFFTDRETGAYHDKLRWSHLMVEADLASYRATADTHVLDRARKSVAHDYQIWKAKPEGELIDVAALARELWLVVDNDTPQGRAGRARMDGKR